MIRLLALIVLLALTTVTTIAQEEVEDQPAEPVTPNSVKVLENFDEPVEQPEYALRKHREGYKPEVKDGALQLLSGNGQEMNTAAWPIQQNNAYDKLTAEIDLTITEGSRGFSVAWLSAANFGHRGVAFKLNRHKLPASFPRAVEPEWDEPNLWGSLAVALDCHNPNTEDPFNEWGNVHNRTQREVSIHWDNREILNRHTDVDFANGEEQKLRIDVSMVVGGAEITVKLGDVAVYDKAFIPHVRAFSSRLAIGAVGDAAGKCKVSDVTAEWSDLAAEHPTPVVFQTFRNAACRRGKHSRQTREFDLIPEDWNVGRTVMTLRLNPLMDRDEWDRQGGIFVYDGETRYELARVLTPFMLWGRSYQWDVDVTDFLSLLRGKCKLEVWMGANVHDGFAADLDFTVYRNSEGTAQANRIVQNLWNGHAHFNKEGSVEKVFGKRTVQVPENAVSARVRICVTGHGALEFKPLGRTVTVGEQVFKDPLSTTDCYLNPQRPQYGTWKYNRAGWGPGSIGRVWEFEVKFEPGKPLDLEYVSDGYKAEKWAEHSMESVIVFDLK
ncbi:MAG: peptide-N-glycosidase F-related protein [Planctomycetota bacterium]|jgi:hypothetical protein